MKFLQCFWTESHARLRCVRHDSSSPLNWIFLPGGPGLGSESLIALTEILQSDATPLPGSFWLLDLPGDGSNTTSDNKKSFQHWSQALVEAVEKLKNPILVAHSTGGMYALSTPRLEPLLKGLVLLDSSPDAGWQAAYAEEAQKRPIPEMRLLEENYLKNPNNETLKELTIASAPHLFTEKGLAKGSAMLKNCAYNYESCQWSGDHFDQTYHAKWVPQNIPTLILSGDLDWITPLKLFQQATEFHRPNIFIKSIKNAGHFPWIDNPEDVLAAFQKYYLSIF